MIKKGQDWSWTAIQWLNYMQNKPLFKDVTIRHAMNGGEKKFTLHDVIMDDTMKICPDGYAEVDGVRHFLFYDGCLFHQCPHNCKTSLDSKVNKMRNDGKRDRVCQKHGVLHKITGCEWKQLRETVQYVNYTSVFGTPPKNTLVKEEQIWEAVKSGSFFGMIQCKIRSPQAVSDKWGTFNFPPIFTKIAVTEDMVSDETKKRLKADKRSFPLAPQLTQVFNHDEYLMTTDLALFYLEIGCELSDLLFAIEYERDQPMKKLVNKITAKRVKATYEKDVIGQQTAKLILNSSYGRTIMRVDNRREFVYIKSDTPEEEVNIKRVVSKSQVIGEYDSGYTEYQKKKSKIVEKIPVQYGFFILQNSKLHFLKFIKVLLDYFDTTGMRLLYADTGKVSEP